MRDKIFISHASPEDNEFTRWLSLQLIREGYSVWCDLIKLKGGEDFWKNIQAAIRERTIKFLYVHSRESNEKDGPLLELATARSVRRIGGLKDFVIPLSIDDLSPDDYNIELHRLNSIDFTESWAKGLNTLIAKLEKDGVGRSSSHGAGVVASWWREQYSAERGLVQRNEDLLSSWFPMVVRPQEVYFHQLRNTYAPNDEADFEPPHPIYLHQSGFLSFAPPEEFNNFQYKGASIVSTQNLRVKDLLEGKHTAEFIDTRTARNVIVYLLEQSWRDELDRRGLGTYELANSNWCHYFTKSQLDNDQIKFTGVNGEKTRRSMIGFRRFKNPDGSFRIRHWHFAVSARCQLYPKQTFSMKTHVLFSDDGRNIWESDSKLHRARMSQCKNWWNDDWRDRLLAFMEWLRQGQDNLIIPLGGCESLEVSPQPIRVTSPVTYESPSKDLDFGRLPINATDSDEIEAMDADFFGDEEDQ